MAVLVSIEQLVWIRLLFSFVVMDLMLLLSLLNCKRELGVLMQMLLVPWTDLGCSSYQTQQTHVVASF